MSSNQTMWTKGMTSTLPRSSAGSSVIKCFLRQQGFRPEASSRGGTLQFKYTVSILQQISICLNRGREESVGNDWWLVMIGNLQLNLARHSFSLFDSAHNKQDEWMIQRLASMDDYRNYPTIKFSEFCADLFPVHRYPSAIKFKPLTPCLH